MKKQTPLHRARRLLALERYSLTARQARWDAEKQERLDRIAELSAEVRGLQQAENRRLDEIARGHLGRAS